ncbi:LRR receptor-like serine/threonine-protein kinase [Populus alba x Populus x berolinensis]|nr:LRR receptor-like serine/threonine-protein kinase [Populus alba x Populus x berolinensis]
MEADAHCCSWERIVCNSSTGRVTELVLDSMRNEEMGDWYLNNSLFLPFQQLNALFLWGNRIAGSVEKKGGYELQRLRNLDYLDLGSNSFDNRILSFVEGFPSFKSLYLSYNRLEGLIDLKESLSSLEVLGLSGNNINKLVASRGPSNLTTLYLHNITVYESSFQLLQSLGAFPNLMTLYLRFNDFRGRILGDELQNLSSLESLYLDWCSLDEHSLQSLGALPSLKNLSLQALSGRVPSGGFLNLKNLEVLDLSSNTLDNSIFQTIGLCDLNHLQELYMYGNDLSGFLSPCLENLTSLQQLDLSSNNLKIPMSLSPLYNLSKLKYFDGSNNEIYAEEDDHSLSPKFQLESIYLSNHGQGAGAFPKFFYNQFSLQYLDLTNIQIKVEFPNWLIENNTYLHDLFLENCSLSGPFLLPKNSHVNLSFLSISMNYFQGQIPSEIGARLPGLEVLFMSGNGFNRSIPFSLGNISSLKGLDLSNNSLQGQIPGWIGNMSSLEFLELSGNNFSGCLPPRFDTSSNLRYVYLSRNKLQGPIAMAFYNSFEMFALDLSHNNLTGSIPKWIDRLSNLRFLILSYNNLEGEIPIRLCRLNQLTLIDLSHNHLSGNILSWMISSHPFPQQYDFYDDLSSSQQSFEFTTKNVSLSYRGNIIHYFTGIDFSCNNFIGEIPHEIGNLNMIKTLVRVAQFATFEESCYKDNPFLCGEPLPKLCGMAMPLSPTPTSTNNEDDGGFMDMEVFYVTFGVAYIIVLLMIGAYFLVDNLPILFKF